MLEIPQDKVAGNEKVLEGLQKAYERARKGRVRAIGLVTCEHLGSEAEYWGDENARAQIVFGCQTLCYVIVSSTAKLQPSNPAYDLAAYDIGLHPVCFDVIPWLASAEMARRAMNAPAPLRVCFVRTSNSLVHLTEERMEFVQKVIRPALALFGAVEDVAAAGGRYIDFVGLRDMAGWFAEGQIVPYLRVPPPAMEKVAETLKQLKKPPVTITLRETGYYAYRNSNNAEWLKFAKWLRKQGENVIVVRDTSKAGEPFDDISTFPYASQDLHIRAALYSQAKCNMFVQNGPWALAQFTDVPWLCFATIDKDCVEECNRPEWWHKFMGLNTEKQIAWAMPKQRIVYKRDTFENMKAAWKEFQQ